MPNFWCQIIQELCLYLLKQQTLFIDEENVLHMHDLYFVLNNHATTTEFWRNIIYEDVSCEEKNISIVENVPMKEY